MDFAGFVNQAMQEIWIANRPDLIDSYYHDEFVGHEEDVVFYKKDLAGYVALYAEKYLEPSFKMDDSVNGQDKVAIRFTFCARARQDHSEVVSNGSAFFYFKENKIVAVWIATEPALD
jgi:hypothetical protein